MLLGIVSDPHGNSYGLEAALSALDDEGVDQIVCAGDVIGYYPFVNETITRLRDRGVTCIAGNHDLYLRGELTVSDERWHAYHLDYVDQVITSANRTWLAELPLHLELEFDATSIRVCHGSPWSAEDYVYPDKVDGVRFQDVRADVLVMGHTHIPLVRKISRPRGELLLLNPGSCGQPRDYIPLAAYAVLDTTTRRARVGRVPFDTEIVCNRCRDLEFGAPVIDILTRTR